FFDDPYKIRDDVRKKLAKQPRITDRQQTNALKQLLIVGEESLTNLTECGSGPEYINEIAYRQFAAKVPFDLVERFTKANQKKRDLRKLLEFLRAEIEVLAAANEDVGAQQQHSSGRNDTRIN